MAAKKKTSAGKIAILMGSPNDWPVMSAAREVLNGFGAESHAAVISAHRAPDKCAAFAKSAEKKGFAAIIAGAGGAAHLPGVLAAHSTLPILGVPIDSSSLHGVDALYAIVQMPRGIPVATFAVGKAGAANAALFAVAMLSLKDAAMAKKLKAFRAQQTKKALAAKLAPADGN